MSVANPVAGLRRLGGFFDAVRWAWAETATHDLTPADLLNDLEERQEVLDPFQLAKARHPATIALQRMQQQNTSDLLDFAAGVVCVPAAVPYPNLAAALRDRAAQFRAEGD